MWYDATNTKGTEMNTETRFFAFRHTFQQRKIRDYGVWVYRGDQGTFIQGGKHLDFAASIHLLDTMMNDRTFIEIDFDDFKNRFKQNPQVRVRFPDVFEYFEPKVEPKTKPTAKPTIFGIKPFKGTVTIKKSIGGPILTAYRKAHCKSNNFDKMFFPYHLAIYLRLMPDSSGLQFTNKFYDLTNEDLDGLAVDGSTITSIKRTPNGVIVSLNIS
jgi:hypothetical protein